MSWYSVTLHNGKPAVVDLSKVLFLSQNSKGQTSLSFNLTLNNPDGKLAVKTLTIRETIESMAKALKARKA